MVGASTGRVMTAKRTIDPRSALGPPIPLAAIAASVPAQAKTPSDRDDRPRILIADDEAGIRSLLRRVLERDGFEVVEATNGREAFELINEFDMAVVLLDLHMPVMDGLRTLQAIRADERTRTLPVILITGTAAETERIRGLESGADDYLTKPFALKELTARIRAQIRARAAWTRQIDRGRDQRRRLAAAVEELPRDGPLVALASLVVERLPEVLGVEGLAILHFAHGEVRAIASGGALRRAFPASSTMPRRIGRDVAHRAASGPWLERSGASDLGSPTQDIAYVPFRLGATPKPLGCLVFAATPGAEIAPLSHRLPDLIDATDFISAVLRPAVERAETTDSAITRLRRIIARHEFVSYLQPIVRLETGTLFAVEALTRFTDKTPPDVQFEQASAVGLGLALQRAAVSAAIEAAEWLPPDVALSVNLSADVLQHEASLPRIVAGAGRPLIVEITEHERIDDYDAVRSALDRLGPGVRLAVDDAGSGYASLRHILALEPAFVKLDIEWVHGIDRDPVRRALVSGLAYFASETGCELIAEGIETQHELEAVRGLGIKLGQGYLLGRPEPRPATQSTG